MNNVEETTLALRLLKKKKVPSAVQSSPLEEKMISVSQFSMLRDLSFKLCPVGPNLLPATDHCTHP